MNWSVFFKRTIGAIIYVIVMFLGLLLDHPMAILCLIALLIFLSTREFFKLSKTIFTNHYFPWIHYILTLLGSIYLMVIMIDKSSMSILPLTIIPLLLLLTGALSKRLSIASSITGILSLLYIALPLAMLLDLRATEKVLPIGILVLIWINDTMAYIVGSFIGKTKFTDISPKKTIEGTMGGIVFTMVIGWVYGQFFQSKYEAYHWIVIAGIVSIFGTLGDLLESQLKRKAGVKDSGNILPGHGGALDRLDSILAVIPVVYVYVYFFIFSSPDSI